MDNLESAWGPVPNRVASTVRKTIVLYRGWARVRYEYEEHTSLATVSGDVHKLQSEIKILLDGLSEMGVLPKTPRVEPPELWFDKGELILFMDVAPFPENKDFPSPGPGPIQVIDKLMDSHGYRVSFV